MGQYFNLLAVMVVKCLDGWQRVRDHQVEGLHQLGDWHHGVDAVQRYSQEPASYLRSVHVRQGQLLVSTLTAASQNVLTPSTPDVPNCCYLKGPAP